MKEDDAQCSACGNLVSSRFRYCGHCGAAQNITQGSAATTDPTTGVAERRQLTVLFCDLCNSILFTQLLDQEDMRTLIQRYQSSCKKICEYHGGYVSRYIGDGVSVFFGYPNPLEDAAERAVAAGLDIVSAFLSNELNAEFQLPEPVQIRIGIATGEVVIGDAIGEGVSRQHIAVGLAPNLAARLQEFSEPNTVLICDHTYSLLGRGFDCADKGYQSFKNMLEPVRCWQASKRTEVLNRFDNRKSAGETVFVGRSIETERLSELWNDVRRGHSRTVVVHGDAGMGKSRLLKEFISNLDDSHQYFVFQCLASRKNTALHLFIGLFDDEKLAVTHIISSDEVGFNSASALDSGSAEKYYERVFTSVADRPSVLLVEDVQWIDNSSLEVIGKLSKSGAPLFLLLTSRTVTAHLDTVLSNYSVLEIEKLSSAAEEQLVDSLLPDKKIPESLKIEIINRSGGTPFYLEEMTRAALAQLQAGTSKHRIDRSIVIPSDIKDALFTRLGDDPLTRSVVQYASVMGASFTKQRLNKLLPAMVQNIDQRVESLVEKGVFTAHETDGSYGFSHSLLKETAYDSLLNSDKRRAHLLLAQMYTQGTSNPEYGDLEVIARHFTLGGALHEAVGYWVRAGRSAAELSANVEALSHFKNGLALYEQPNAENLSPELKLELQLGLSASLIFINGPGSTEVRDAYNRALELCRESKISDLHFMVYWGWWRISLNFEVHRERANDLLLLAEELENPELVLQAHHCQWATLFHLGRIQNCCDHIDEGLDLYKPNEHLAGASMFGGHDAKVCALGERGLSEWLMGSLDASLFSVERSLEWAHSSGHTGSIAHALDIGLMLCVYREDYAVMLEHSNSLITIANKHGSPDHLAKGHIYKGWATANLGDTAAGYKEFVEGMNLQIKIGTREDSAVFDCMRAIFLMRSSQYRDAKELLENSLKEAEQTGIVYYNSELIRLRTVAKYLTGEFIHDQIVEEFDHAISIAKQRDMKSLELRAMHSAIEFELKTTEVSEIRVSNFKLLLDSFVEGRDLHLVRSAEKLLTNLA